MARAAESQAYPELLTSIREAQRWDSVARAGVAPDRRALGTSEPRALTGPTVEASEALPPRVHRLATAGSVRRQHGAGQLLRYDS